MASNAKEKTALATSVGADERQSVQNTIDIIPTSDTEINPQIENSQENLEEMYRKMQRLTDPHYLHTITMTELYQTAYQSRPSIIDGLLYAGAYILAGAPKSASYFWWHRLLIMSASGESSGILKSTRGLFFISLWKMIISESRVGCL